MASSDSAYPRIPFGRAHLIASTVTRDIQRAGLPVDSITPVGSLRRFAPDVGDVSLLGVAPADRHLGLLLGLGRIPGANKAVQVGDAAVTIKTERGPVHVLLTSPEQAGAALLWHTGSRQHVGRLQDRAARLGLTLADGRVMRNGTILETPTEEAVYQYLELPFVAPELREGGDEIEHAEGGRLPRLIERTRIRGDLHMHTTWSDGRDTVDAMAQAARALGYEYIAITDHSQRSWASRAVYIEQVPQQREEIARVQERYSDIQILHGIEIEIMPDGTLDFEDDLLGTFDVVLASLHDHAGHDASRLTERYLAAIRHPLVNIITHPANRTPGSSPGYDLDFDYLFAAAAESGAAVEVDGAPGHLDMDGTLARRAMASPVTIAVNSDSHRADALARQMRFGVGTARRGWVEPERVLNTGGVADVRDFVARKRRGAAA